MGGRISELVKFIGVISHEPQITSPWVTAPEWMEPFFYDHKKNFSRGARNFRRVSPFKHTGYALKVKGNTALPILDNTGWTK